VLVQNTQVLNLGVAAANSGGNIGIGNASTNIAATGQGAFGLFAASNGSVNVDLLAQISFGLLSSNSASANNLSDGFTTILTGIATGTGNDSVTAVTQES
jgi:hypothetical protein